MVAKWDSLLLSLPTADGAEPTLKWCCFNHCATPFDLLVLSAREEYDLAEPGADVLQFNWSRYFEKVAFTIGNLTAEEYARKLHPS